MHRYLLALAVVVTAGVAAAHMVFPQVRGERIVELRLDRDPIRIEYRLGLAFDAAVPVRRAADTDGDFMLSPAEERAALDKRTAALLASLTVCTGRELGSVTCRHPERRDVERVDAQGWVPGPAGDLHFLWTIALHTSAGHIGAIRVEDRSSQPGVEITEVRFTSPPDVKLQVAAAAGTHGVASRFTWIEAKRPPGPRVIVAAWPPPSRRILWVAGGAALAAAALLMFRRMRKRVA